MRLVIRVGPSAMAIKPSCDRVGPSAMAIKPFCDRVSPSAMAINPFCDRILFPPAGHNTQLLPSSSRFLVTTCYYCHEGRLQNSNAFCRDSISLQTKRNAFSAFKGLHNKGKFILTEKSSIAIISERAKSAWHRAT